MKTFLPNHPLFTDFDPILLETSTEIDVSLGMNPAFANDLTGDGNVPCWILPHLKNGRYAGTARTAGFVVLLDFDDLKAAGFSEDELWYALGANQGQYADPAADNRPICSECVLADQHAHFDDDDPPCENCNPDDETILYHRLPIESHAPCWSCVESLAEEL